MDSTSVRILLALVAIAASQADDFLNPAERKIVKQLYLKDKSGNLCEENPMMATECSACNDIGLESKDACCSDLIHFSECHYQLIPLLQELEGEDKEEMGNKISQLQENEVIAEPQNKRYIAARWGLTKGTSPVAWGKPIKRYGMASGRRFNFNKFKEGSYSRKPSRE